jgi:hypothetical protein
MYYEHVVLVEKTRSTLCLCVSEEDRLVFKDKFYSRNTTGSVGETVAAGEEWREISIQQLLM